MHPEILLGHSNVFLYAQLALIGHLFEYLGLPIIIYIVDIYLSPNSPANAARPHKRHGIPAKADHAQ